MILAARGFLGVLVVCWLAALGGYVGSKNQAHWPYDVAAIGLVCAVAGIWCLLSVARGTAPKEEALRHYSLSNNPRGKVTAPHRRKEPPRGNRATI